MQYDKQIFLTKSHKSFAHSAPKLYNFANMGMFSSKPTEGGNGDMGNDTDRPVIDIRKIRRLFWMATFGRLHKWLNKPLEPRDLIEDLYGGGVN